MGPLAQASNGEEGPSTGVLPGPWSPTPSSQGGRAASLGGHSVPSPSPAWRSLELPGELAKGGGRDVVLHAQSCLVRE